MKKYEMADETIFIDGKTLHRIKALIDFEFNGIKVKQGDLGGFIEKKSNLSQGGNAWVSDDACVSDDARVNGNAWVSDDARVSGNAWVSGNARVSGNACVSGNDYIV